VRQRKIESPMTKKPAVNVFTHDVGLYSYIFQIYVVMLTLLHWSSLLLKRKFVPSETEHWSLIRVQVVRICNLDWDCRLVSGGWGRSTLTPLLWLSLPRYDLLAHCFFVDFFVVSVFSSGVTTVDAINVYKVAPKM